MKGPISEYFEKRIIKQHAVPGESTSYHHVVAFGRRIQQVTKLWQQMFKVAVHGENIFTGRGGQTFRDGKPNSVGRDSMERFHSRIFCGKLGQDLPRAVVTAIVYRNNFVDIVAIELKNAMN